MLSELDMSVLKSVILGNKSIEKISKMTGVPVYTTEKALENLIKKGYIDEYFQPTEKAYRETKWLDSKHSFHFHGEDVAKIGKLVLDLVTVLAIIILFITVIYFLIS